MKCLLHLNLVTDIYHLINYSISSYFASLKTNFLLVVFSQLNRNTKYIINYTIQNLIGKAKKYIISKFCNTFNQVIPEIYSLYFGEHIWEDLPWWLSHQKIGNFCPYLCPHCWLFNNTWSILMISAKPIGRSES